MFKVVKLKPVLFALLILMVGVFGCVALTKATQASAANKLNYTIVLDAGHGGVDGGCVGATGISEAEINLAVTFKLKSMLENFGFNVVLTRSSSGGLYSLSAKNKKQSDMEKRKEIIKKANPNMVVSVHMNSYVDSSQHGAQTFYKAESEQSQVLAETIQLELVKNLVEAREFANHTDLYILDCVSAPSVVVEGGFLSNSAEESLLITPDYQNKLAYSIFCGVLKYFEVVNTVN